MSGIFKGDSIYKSGGGGGGGYKDGGQLVDGDFIKVENNTVSTYTNETRNDINYYFEFKDGEVLNSIIELTNNLNATVHVYVLKNGFYYPLGNVGGNTVNSGEEYKINITGDSYSIEQVTPASDPEYVALNGTTYKMIKRGSLYWLAENYKSNGNEWFYPYDVKNLNIKGWHVPSKTEIETLRNESSTTEMCSTSGWSGTQGTNTFGFNLEPKGSKRPNDSYQDDGTNAYLCLKESYWTNGGFVVIRPTDYFVENSYSLSIERRYNVRLCKVM